MKKLLILESILIIFLVLAWNVSNSNEKTPGHLFCNSMEMEIFNLSNYYRKNYEENRDRLNELFSKTDNEIEKSKFLSGMGKEEFFKVSEEILIRIERRMSIYDKFCSGHYPAMGILK